MDQLQTDIDDMKCWVFRMAQTRWHVDPSGCADIFKENDILGYIERHYGLLHLSSYECALDDIEEMLRNRGVSI